MDSQRRHQEIKIILQLSYLRKIAKFRIFPAKLTTQIQVLFQLGLTGNLSGQYVGIKFDAVLAKGASYNHSVVCVQRP